MASVKETISSLAYLTIPSPSKQKMIMIMIMITMTMHDDDDDDDDEEEEDDDEDDDDDEEEEEDDEDDDSSENNNNNNNVTKGKIRTEQTEHAKTLLCTLATDLRRQRNRINISIWATAHLPLP